MINLSYDNEKKIEEALKLAEHEASKWFESKEANELKKIGQLCEVCLELLPENVRDSLRQRIDNQSVPEILIKNNLGNRKLSYLKDISCDDRRQKQKHHSAICNDMVRINIPEQIVIDYDLVTFFELQNKYYKGSSIENFNGIIKLINERKKKKCYTSALIEIIEFIINFDFYSNCSEYEYEDGWRNFRYFYFLAELFIEIGAIDAALKLYTIDENIFNNPNILSMLASNALKTGDLESSIKIVKNLITREPHHPSIPILQSDIKRLEQRNLLKSTLPINFSKIDELSGVEFENLLLDKFTVMGFKVESTPQTGDFGADLIVENSEGSRIIVQCKRFKSKVNLKAVQEVMGAMGYYVGDYGVVITNNSFLKSAVKLAESHDIELWDGDKLVSFLTGDLSFSKIIGTAK